MTVTGDGSDQNAVIYVTFNPDFPEIEKSWQITDQDGTQLANGNVPNNPYAVPTGFTR